MNTRWIVIALALVPVVGLAGSLKDKEEAKKEDGFLQSEMKEVNDYCGSKIKAVGDWDSFKGKLNNEGSHVGAFCAQAIDGIKGVCTGGDEGKKAVREGITTFRCAAGTADVAIDGKVVTYQTTLDDKRAGVSKTVREYLRTKL